MSVCPVITLHSMNGFLYNLAEVSVNQKTKSLSKIKVTVASSMLIFNATICFQALDFSYPLNGNDFGIIWHKHLVYQVMIKNYVSVSVVKVQ